MNPHPTPIPDHPLGYQSTNPATGESIRAFKDCSDQKLESALQTAADCFERWRGLPFGGMKHSGYGRELSRLGIQEFMNKKLVRTQSIDAPA